MIELEPAGTKLRQVVVEPLGKCGIEIANLAVGIDGEEAGWRVVEIVDGVLQHLKCVLLALELARYVGNRPDREAGGAL